ncbi:uncharacterized protein [Clytia hemisphaerica]|uniref:IRF tryptophan pentad repeat domain-containing protein n=1 Tax=Clytia hemisphaerica TaxID=252671 RepID=A0A7M5XKD6_9CNID
MKRINKKRMPSRRTINRRILSTQSHSISPAKQRPKLKLPTLKINKDCRLNLPSWIKEQIQNDEYSGLKWVDEKKGHFLVSWKHASRQGWLEEEDGRLFKDWALYTGVYKPGRDDPNPKQWKANFRCALNASAAITSVKGCGKTNGKDAHRVFKLDKTHGGFVTKRNKGQRLKLNTKILSSSSQSSKSIKTESDGDIIPSPTSSTSSSDSSTSFPTIRDIKSEPMEDQDFPQGCQETTIRLPKNEVDDLEDVKPTLTLNMKDTNRKSSKSSSKKRLDNKEFKSLLERSRLYPPFQQLQRFCQMQSMAMNPAQQYSFPTNNNQQNHSILNSIMYSNLFNNGYNLDTSSGTTSSPWRYSSTQQEDQLRSMHENFEIMLQAANELEASTRRNENVDDDEANDIFKDISMRSCSPVSISSSISTEDLEKLLMETQSNTIEDDDIECYGVKTEAEVSSCITTSADPYLSVTNASTTFSDDIRTSLMSQVDI